MSGDPDAIGPDAGRFDGKTYRTATVRTTHADAELVAAALGPDDTDSMVTRVDGDAIECTVERETTGGLRSTVDDYVVNLQVADRVIERTRAYRDTTTSRGDRLRADDDDRSRTDSGTRSDTNHGDRPHTDESDINT
ncbi:KEOPS complex subunit Pcc1 [Halorubrum sp. DTA98]|uniref:KEOPS complex subunit Pcc1 n=1 Tax=Halorubrum sp. DTA98 TaxID=3402163 RepID=UPI003AAC6997